MDANKTESGSWRGSQPSERFDGKIAQDPEHTHQRHGADVSVQPDPPSRQDLTSPCGGHGPIQVLVDQEDQSGQQEKVLANGLQWMTMGQRCQGASRSAARAIQVGEAMKQAFEGNPVARHEPGTRRPDQDRKGNRPTLGQGEPLRGLPRRPHPIDSKARRRQSPRMGPGDDMEIGAIPSIQDPHLLRQVVVYIISIWPQLCWTLILLLLSRILDALELQSLIRFSNRVHSAATWS